MDTQFMKIGRRVLTIIDILKKPWYNTHTEI